LFLKKNIYNEGERKRRKKKNKGIEIGVVAILIS